ncbi:MAG: type III-B CRISPR-associated protein Cas10/Cmr2, partial [Verrucomicrobia bacterium]|nr:type III-B CRISPR-associated protein Cas10/Cmr2 [Verrucomicrobiota bacterium]
MTDWKRKLAAFLHDPPSKALDIADHEQFAKTLYRQAGFDDNESELFAKLADWSASSADRFPFPNSQAAGLSCNFDGVRNAFHHPLGPPAGQSAPNTLPFKGPFVTADLARETDQSVQPVVDDFGSLPADDADASGQRWRARFFAHWRLWQKFAMERDYRFGFLPADTRLPDHTVWNHMQMVSALQTCANGVGKDAVIKAAFLKLQIGPVQEFIAQARSIRDLWSGSYLLSWLMAAGLKALSAEVGPDAVIYPSLRNQPLFDLQWRDELWSHVRMHGRAKTVWDTLGHTPDDILTPNLPNAFFALVPRDTGKDLAHRVEKEIREELQKIATSCWEHCEEASMTADEPGISEKRRHERFKVQIERFLSISWQLTPWPTTVDQTLNLVADLPADRTPGESDFRQRVRAVIDAVINTWPGDHRDGRYYTDNSKTELNNLGLGWSLLYAANSWALGAVRHTRCFHGWASGGWQTGAFNNKDSLNGRDEAVAGGREWQRRAADNGGHWKSLFKKDDWLGAVTLIKRVWHVAYLKGPPWDLQTDAQHFSMPNTHGIAAHVPFVNADDEEDPEDIPSSEKYFAVLAFDGDEIGRWVSGTKTPRFESQLANYTDGSGNPQGALPYFKRYIPQLLAERRPISPSYHLQFSEALTNFALQCARPIVEVFDGRLIYSGGDDIVALLPADTALDCAHALRMGFQASKDLRASLIKNAESLLRANEHNKRSPSDYQKLAANGSLLSPDASGFVSRLDRADTNAKQAIPFIVPGPAADGSAGIAIAHFKAPLQDVVRAAQRAVKCAKQKVQDGGLDRSAVAVTLLKRSGETIEWGAKWDTGGIELYRDFADAMANRQLSGKFPHR